MTAVTIAAPSPLPSAVVDSHGPVKLTVLPRRQACLWMAGPVAYEPVWLLQRRMVEERLAGRGADALLLLEHDPTYTLGRRTKAEHVGGDETALRQAGAAVYRIERGGSVTYHAPGQIVGYPILRVTDYCAGPKAYMHKLETVLIRTLALWGIEAGRRPGYPGVWVGENLAKIAAMGTHLRRGISMHGFALNVTVDLAPFARILPCGMDDCRVTSMAQVLGREPEVELVRTQLAEAFAQEFALNWMEPRHRPIDSFLHEGDTAWPT